jgi:hypothetical protein
LAVHIVLCVGIFNWLGFSSGLEKYRDSFKAAPGEVLGALEDGRRAEVADQLTVSLLLVFILTRIKDFKLRIAEIVTANVFYPREGLKEIGSKMRPGLAGLETADWQHPGLLVLLWHELPPR